MLKTGYLRLLTSRTDTDFMLKDPPKLSLADIHLRLQVRNCDRIWSVYETDRKIVNHEAMQAKVEAFFGDLPALSEETHLSLYTVIEAPTPDNCRGRYGVGMRLFYDLGKHEIKWLPQDEQLPREVRRFAQTMCEYLGLREDLVFDDFFTRRGNGDLPTLTTTETK